MKAERAGSRSRFWQRFIWESSKGRSLPGPRGNPACVISSLTKVRRVIPCWAVSTSSWPWCWWFTLRLGSHVCLGWGCPWSVSVNLEEILSNCFRYFSCSFLSFFSFRCSHYAYIKPFIVASQALNILLWIFFSSLCSICFLFLQVSTDMSSSSEIRSSAVSSLLISLSKVFFIYVTILVISSISIWFFL